VLVAIISGEWSACSSKIAKWPASCRSFRRACNEERMPAKVVQYLAVAITLTACAQGTTGGPETPPGDKVVFTGDRDKDWAQIVALEDEAKALVKTTGCDDLSKIFVEIGRAHV